MTFEYWYDGADSLWHWHLKLSGRVIARSDRGSVNQESCLAIIQEVQRSMTAGAPIQLSHKNLPEE